MKPILMIIGVVIVVPMAFQAMLGDHRATPPSGPPPYNSRSEMLRDADELVRDACELERYRGIAMALAARGVDCASLRRWRAGL